MKKIFLLTFITLSFSLQAFAFMSGLAEDKPTTVDVSNIPVIIGSTNYSFGSITGTNVNAVNCNGGVGEINIDNDLSNVAGLSSSCENLLGEYHDDSRMKVLNNEDPVVMARYCNCISKKAVQYNINKYSDDLALAYKTRLLKYMGNVWVNKFLNQQSTLANLHKSDLEHKKQAGEILNIKEFKNVNAAVDLQCKDITGNDNDNSSDKYLKLAENFINKHITNETCTSRGADSSQSIASRLKRAFGKLVPELNEGLSNKEAIAMVLEKVSTLQQDVTSKSSKFVGSSKDLSTNSCIPMQVTNQSRGFVSIDEAASLERLFANGEITEENLKFILEVDKESIKELETRNNETPDQIKQRKDDYLKIKKIFIQNPKLMMLAVEESKKEKSNFAKRLKSYQDSLKKVEKEITDNGRVVDFKPAFSKYMASYNMLFHGKAGDKSASTVDKIVEEKIKASCSNTDPTKELGLVQSLASIACTDPDDLALPRKSDISFLPEDFLFGSFEGDFNKDPKFVGAFTCERPSNNIDFGRMDELKALLKYQDYSSSSSCGLVYNASYCQAYTVLKDTPNYHESRFKTTKVINEFRNYAFSSGDNVLDNDDEILSLANKASLKDNENFCQKAISSRFCKKATSEKEKNLCLMEYAAKNYSDLQKEFSGDPQLLKQLFYLSFQYKKFQLLGDKDADPTNINDNSIINGNEDLLSDFRERAMEEGYQDPINTNHIVKVGEKGYFDDLEDIDLSKKDDAEAFAKNNAVEISGIDKDMIDSVMSEKQYIKPDVTVNSSDLRKEVADKIDEKEKDIASLEKDIDATKDLRDNAKTDKERKAYEDQIAKQEGLLANNNAILDQLKKMQAQLDDLKKENKELRDDKKAQKAIASSINTVNDLNARGANLLDNSYGPIIDKNTVADKGADNSVYTDPASAFGFNGFETGLVDGGANNVVTTPTALINSVTEGDGVLTLSSISQFDDLLKDVEVPMNSLVKNPMFIGSDDEISQMDFNTIQSLRSGDDAKAFLAINQNTGSTFFLKYDEKSGKYKVFKVDTKTASLDIDKATNRAPASTDNAGGSSRSKFLKDLVDIMHSK